MKALWVILGILIFAFFHLSIFPSSPSITSIQLGQTVLDDIEIADTGPERARGLSGRNSIGNNFGLLFIFERPGNYGFWMKDMSFPIDIIWLDQDFIIVGLKENAEPSSYPQVFYPASPASFVLEVRSGLSAEENLEIGKALKPRLSGKIF